MLSHNHILHHNHTKLTLTGNGGISSQPGGGGSIQDGGGGVLARPHAGAAPVSTGGGGVTDRICQDEAGNDGGDGTDACGGVGGNGGGISSYLNLFLESVLS